jgi:hypothetical protein
MGMTAPDQQPDTDPLQVATTAFQDAQKAEATAKEELLRARAAHREAWGLLSEQRAKLADVIADEARKGRRNRDIRLVTNYTPERIRQICRERGVAGPE